MMDRIAHSKMSPRFARVLLAALLLAFAACSSPTPASAAEADDREPAADDSTPAAAQPATGEDDSRHHDDDADDDEPAAATQPSDELNAWLEKLEERGRSLQTLQARLRWDQVIPLQGDEQRRFGQLIYTAGPPSRFAVHFDQLIFDDDRLEEQDMWWIFDGRWLVERHDDKKQFFKRQIAPPSQDAVDPLATGEGPFPVPIRAGRDELLRRFEITLVPPDESDPENTLHLRLQPRPRNGPRSGDLDYSEIDVWYHRDALLPVQARAIKHESGDEQIFHLSKLKVNEPIDEAAIDTRTPSERGERGWLEEITPWSDTKD